MLVPSCIFLWWDTNSFSEAPHSSSMTRLLHLALDTELEAAPTCSFISKPRGKEQVSGVGEWVVLCWAVCFPLCPPFSLYYNVLLVLQILIEPSRTCDLMRISSCIETSKVLFVRACVCGMPVKEVGCMSSSAPGSGECGPIVLQSKRRRWPCVWFIPVSLPHPPLSCFYPHGGDQEWRQRSVLSYTLQLLFVEKAGGAHTMVKVVLNLPFRNNSSMWTDIGPEQSKATCRVS